MDIMFAVFLLRVHQNDIFFSTNPAIFLTFVYHFTHIFRICSPYYIKKSLVNGILIQGSKIPFKLDAECDQAVLYENNCIQPN